MSAGGGTDAVAAITVLVCLLLLAQALLGQAFLRPKTKVPSAIQGGNPNVSVWADKVTGLYYCPGQATFGKGRGKYLTQQDAQGEHFRAAFDKPCEEQ